MSVESAVSESLSQKQAARLATRLGVGIPRALEYVDGRPCAGWIRRIIAEELGEGWQQQGWTDDKR